MSSWAEGKGNLYLVKLYLNGKKRKDRELKLYRLTEVVWRTQVFVISLYIDTSLSETENRKNMSDTFDQSSKRQSICYKWDALKEIWWPNNYGWINKWHGRKFRHTLWLVSEGTGFTK